MESVHRSCVGLDVHKKSVAACVRRLDSSGKVHKHFRQFGTMTGELEELVAWLKSHEVTHVAMESTGVYWKPIYNLLEERFEVLLVNAQHIKHVSGRKTDMKDCEWIAQLLQHGLLEASFIPERLQRDLRDLTRSRVKCVEQRTGVANRIHKVLQDANIKLSSVATEILGVSGRSMIRAIIAGEEDPEKLANLARQSLRGKIPQLKEALRGKVRDHHRFLLETLFEQLISTEETIEKYSKRIDELLGSEPFVERAEEDKPLPFGEATTLLRTMPGISRVAAHAILAETGTDMSQFPSAGHLCSWCGISAGNNESGGKQRSAKIPKGNRWLRRILVETALSAGRSKNTYLSAQYRRLASRRGRKKAAVAVAHSMLESIYHMLKRHVEYQDLGPHHFDTLEPDRLTRYLVKRLENLGHKVTLEPRAMSA